MLNIFHLKGSTNPDFRGGEGGAFFHVLNRILWILSSDFVWSFGSVTVWGWLITRRHLCYVDRRWFWSFDSLLFRQEIVFEFWLASSALSWVIYSEVSCCTDPLVCFLNLGPLFSGILIPFVPLSKGNNGRSPSRLLRDRGGLGFMYPYLPLKDLLVSPM